MKELIDKAKKLGIPEETLKKYLDKPNKGLTVMMLRNWIRNREAGKKKPAPSPSKKRQAISIATPPRRGQRRPTETPGDTSSWSPKHHRGYIQRGVDTRDVYIRKVGSDRYRLKVGKVEYAVTFNKKGLEERFLHFELGGYEIHVNLKEV